MHHHHLSDILRGVAGLPGAVDDDAHWHDAWRRGTEQARRRTAEVRIDLSYGRRGGESLDLYQPGHRLDRRPQGLDEVDKLVRSADPSINGETLLDMMQMG